MTVGGPTSGVSLSQPGVMLSHRPHSMIDMDPRLGPRPHMGGASSQEKKSGSVKSAESLERAGLSIDDFEDIDPGEEDSHKVILRGVAQGHVILYNIIIYSSRDLCFKNFRVRPNF